MIFDGWRAPNSIIFCQSLRLSAPNLGNKQNKTCFNSFHGEVKPNIRAMFLSGDNLNAVVKKQISTILESQMLKDRVQALVKC